MSEKIYTGTIVFRKISNIPWVEFTKGKDPVYLPVFINQIEEVKESPGAKVKFVVRQLTGFTGDYAELLDQ